MDNFNLNFHVNDSLKPAEEKSLSLSLYRCRTNDKSMKKVVRIWSSQLQLGCSKQHHPTQGNSIIVHISYMFNICIYNCSFNFPQRIPMFDPAFLSTTHSNDPWHAKKKTVYISNYTNKCVYIIIRLSRFIKYSSQLSQLILHFPWRKQKQQPTRNPWGYPKIAAFSPWSFPLKKEQYNPKKNTCCF